MGTHNKSLDLNNLLFEQLEKLTEAENEEEIRTEIGRSKAIAAVANSIISNAGLALDAARLKAEYGKEANISGLLEG